MTFQQLIMKLQQYWADQGCVLLQPYDMEVGAGTFHPATFLAAVGPEPLRAAYVQPSRRPTDGRYGENPNRLQQYFQFQVILKPSPPDFQALYLGSLRALGLDFLKDDIRFVEDDWESPTLGAWGLGWEVWLNGMEVTQFTYFQQVGGLDCRPVTGEITYGLERIAMYLQGVDNLFDLKWGGDKQHTFTYRDLYMQNEREQCAYNFEHADVEHLFAQFTAAETMCKKLLEHHLPLPAYEQVLTASHTFNLLDARHAIGATERARYIGRTRQLARGVARIYFKVREEAREREGFPRGEVDLAPVAVEAVKPRRAAAVKAGARRRSLLVEIGTEELPARGLETMAHALASDFTARLHASKVVESPDEYRYFATPRRLAVFVREVATGRLGRLEPRRGPTVAIAYDAAGEPTPAAIGFAKSCGVEVSDLIRDPSDTYLMHHHSIPPTPLAAIVSEALEESLRRLPIPKRMRWGNESVEFVRPVHWLVALYGEEVMDMEILGCRAGRDSRSHPFHIPDPLTTNGADQHEAQLCDKGSDLLTIREADQYEAQLRDEGRVIANFHTRRDEICKQLNGLLKSDNEQRVDKDDLLGEVTALVEWPHALRGDFDERFLELPKEVLISVMRDHQKYFPLTDRNDGLLPHFFTVSNIDSTDPDHVRKGNERVLRARLADAEFFWGRDSQIKLEDRFDQLRKVLFHARLGSLYDKAIRMEKLSKIILNQYNHIKQREQGGEDDGGPSMPAISDRITLMCKADLVTDMVAEFPALQGIIGKHYAASNKEPSMIANAIEQHYWPRHARDRLPETLLSQSIAIADRLDSLVGLYATGEIPSGDKDPFAMRRAALGVLRILIGAVMFLDVKKLMEEACRGYVEQYEENKVTVRPDQNTVDALFDFMLERLKFHYQSQRYEPWMIASVLACRPPHPLACEYRLLAVRGFFHSKHWDEKGDVTALIIANKRIANLLSKSAETPPDEYQDELFLHPAEKELAKCVKKAEREYTEAQDYSIILMKLVPLREPVDTFFEQVLVMDKDPEIRLNRLALLANVRKLFLRVADFSYIPIER